MTSGGSSLMPAQQILLVTAPHRLHSASRAFTSATSVALIGAVSPTVSASRGIAPLITSISDGCRERWSSSMDGRASGILAPNLRICSSGSPTCNLTPRASATSTASRAQCWATHQVFGSDITSPIVLPVRHEVAENAILKINFSHTIRQAGIGAEANHFHSVVVHMPRRA